MGVRAGDAKAFCEWLTLRQGGEFVYRLPQPKEIAETAFFQGGIACWCKDENGFSLAGISRTIEEEMRRRLDPLYVGIAFTGKAQPLNTAAPEGDDLSRALDMAHSGALAFNLSLLLTVCRLSVRMIHSSIASALSGVGVLSLSLTRARDLDHELALDLDLARARDLNFGLNHAQVHASALLLSLDHDFGHHGDFDLVRARDFDLDLTRARAINRDLAAAQALNRDLAHDLSVSHARTLSLDLNHALILSRILIHALALARNLATARTLVFDHNQNAVQTIKRTLVIVQACADNLNYALDRSLNGQVYEGLFVVPHQPEAACEGETADVSQLPQDLQKGLEDLPDYVQELLPDILAAAAAQTPFDARHAQRRFVARMLEFVLAKERAQSQQSKPGWRRWLWRKPADDADQKQTRELAAQLYWWLQIVIAREEGKLPAWEGVRIVRELPEDQMRAAR